jgi:hypothetical protein
MKKTLISATLAALLGLSSSAVLAASGNATVDFSHGMQDWYGGHAGETGAIDTALGNGTPAFHVDTIGYGFQLKTFVNSDFTGNYAAYPSLTLSIDVTVAKLAIGFPDGELLTDKFYVELRDYDKPSALYEYSSVWFDLGTIGAGRGTQHLSTTIADTSAGPMPAGWHGLGDYDQDGNDTLPYGQSFGRILGDVDEVVFGTTPPNGGINAPNYYNLSVDNIAIQATAVPEPEPLALLTLGLGMIGLVARRRRQRAGAQGGQP